MGLELTERQLEAFRRYRDELLAWNRRVNLTAITDPLGVERLLFLDSLTLLLTFQEETPPRGAPLGLPPAAGGWRPARPPAPGESGGSKGMHPLGGIPSAARLIDVGSGAGIPGLPLKLAMPHLHVTLLEATGKKVRFLEHVARLLALDGLEVVNARAEELARVPGKRESYDLVVARALGPLRVLVELCLPFARVGGLVIAPKGAEASREIEEAGRALDLLGGRLRELIPVEVPGLPAGRHLVVLEKASATPAVYPRRAGLPAKRPL